MTEVVDYDGRRVPDGAANFHFDGHLAVFLTPGYDNWFHWLIQCLPRLKSLVDSDLHFDAIQISDLCPAAEQSFNIAKRTLGIDAPSFYVPRGQRAKAKHLVTVPIAWKPTDGFSVPPWIVPFLRSLT
jgi:hypothetical protein